MGDFLTFHGPLGCHRRAWTNELPPGPLPPGCWKTLPHVRRVCRMCEHVQVVLADRFEYPYGDF